MLRLTARGHRANDTDDGTVEAAVSVALEGVNARDRAATRRVLARLAGHLKPAPEHRHRDERPLRARGPAAADRRASSATIPTSPVAARRGGTGTRGARRWNDRDPYWPRPA
ncbi:MAG: hypothetical protein R2712_18610 [Vicinamibacterales bacterium]